MVGAVLTDVGGNLKIEGLPLSTMILFVALWAVVALAVGLVVGKRLRRRSQELEARQQADIRNSA